MKVWVFCALHKVSQNESGMEFLQQSSYYHILLSAVYKMLQTLNVYWPCCGECRQIRNSYYWASWPRDYKEQTHSSLIPWTYSKTHYSKSMCHYRLNWWSFPVFFFFCHSSDPSCLQRRRNGLRVFMSSRHDYCNSQVYKRSQNAVQKC